MIEPLIAGQNLGPNQSMQSSIRRLDPTHLNRPLPEKQAVHAIKDNVPANKLFKMVTTIRQQTTCRDQAFSKFTLKART
jgi:hypothetical protein